MILVEDDVYFDFGPSSDVIDQAVTARYPAWEPFRQTVMGQSLTIGNIFEQASFGGPEYGVNPAVLQRLGAHAGSTYRRPASRRASLVHLRCVGTA